MAECAEEYFGELKPFVGTIKRIHTNLFNRGVLQEYGSGFPSDQAHWEACCSDPQLMDEFFKAIVNSVLGKVISITGPLAEGQVVEGPGGRTVNNENLADGLGLCKIAVTDIREALVRVTQTLWVDCETGPLAERLCFDEDSQKLSLHLTDYHFQCHDVPTLDVGLAGLAALEGGPFDWEEHDNLWIGPDGQSTGDEHASEPGSTLLFERRLRKDGNLVAIDSRYVVWYGERINGGESSGDDSPLLFSTINDRLILGLLEN
ncbi:MAG TPA: hypothetical protein VIT68_04400 [Candidatus Gracilibacteria bacterium]